MVTIQVVPEAPATSAQAANEAVLRSLTPAELTPHDLMHIVCYGEGKVAVSTDYPALLAVVHKADGSLAKCVSAHVRSGEVRNLHHCA